MASEVDKTGMTPEQKFGLMTGAGFALAGVAMAIFRQKRQKKSPVQETADRILANPSVKNLYSAARESLEDAKGRVDPKTFEAAKAELARQRDSLPKRWQKDIEPAGRQLAERALETAHRLQEQGSDFSRDFSKRWEKEYAPAARSIAGDAVAQTDEIYGRARKRATEISDTARKDYIPKIAPMAAAASGAIADAFNEQSGKLKKLKKNGYKPGISLPKRDSGSNAVKRAGEGVVDATSQIMMIGFWGAALGAVVYYGILDEERREKVRNFLTDAWEQISELIEDFKDDDVFDDTESTEKF